MELDRMQNNTSETTTLNNLNVENEQTLIFESPEMQSIIDIADRIAKSNINVIITGEIGTGKELVAREIHKRSNRSKNPFIIVNCSSLTENSFDAELFGCVEGSLSKNSGEKTGLIEQANNGTIFFDEITSLSQNMQTKLLRFAQSNEYAKVGDNQTRKANVRIVTSTSKRIEQEIKNNNLREDLFYRLNTIVLRVPPLRKRKEDLSTLVRSFMSPLEDITPEALEVLKNYSWPGNVRELQNCIERIKILLPYETSGRRNIITLDDVPMEIRESSKKLQSLESIPDKLDDIERRHILKSLEYFNGNKSKTATALGITLKTLYNKLNKYNVEGWL